MGVVAWVTFMLPTSDRCARAVQRGGDQAQAAVAASLAERVPTGRERCSLRSWKLTFKQIGCNRSDLDPAACDRRGDREVELRLPSGSATTTTVPAVPQQVAVDLLDDDAKMNADPKFDASLRRNTCIRSSIACRTAIVQRTASSTLLNSTSEPSPVRLTARPCDIAISGSGSLRTARSRASVSSSSAATSRL